MRKFKGVIFDLDGTLLDTIADLSDSVNEMLESYGYPQHTYAEYKRMIGNGIQNLVRRSLPEAEVTDELAEEALARFASVYDRRYLDQTVPYEGITELLFWLQEKGVKLGVNSNKRTDYTESLINKIFPDIRFADVIGERTGKQRKPDPEAALELAACMELHPEEIVYIGDSKVDMQTGANAGMSRIGVLWGFRDQKELEEYGADAVVASAESLKKYF